jgi:hypothetical protein
MIRQVLAVNLLLIVAPGHLWAQDSTSDLIRGTRVDNLVKVKRTSDATREQTKVDFQRNCRLRLDTNS